VAISVGAVDTVHAVGLVALAIGLVCPDAALQAQQGWSQAGWLATRWEQVVVDILDEDSLSLLYGKYPLDKSAIFLFRIADIQSRPRIRSSILVYMCVEGRVYRQETSTLGAKKETQKVWTQLGYLPSCSIHRRRT
jgi:hypothetical protein